MIFDGSKKSLTIVQVIPYLEKATTSNNANTTSK